MAKFKFKLANGASYDAKEILYAIEALIDSVVTTPSMTATSFTAEVSDATGDYRYEAVGTNLSYTGLGWTGGTVSKITVFKDNVKVGVLTGTIDAATFVNLYAEEYFNGNDTAFEEYLLEQNWVIDLRAGASANDKLLKDVLFGDGYPFNPKGNDTFYAAGGNDKLYMGDGNDKAYGGNGKDTLWGGNGKDRLDGGKGNDKLTGNAGRDKFVFKNNYDKDKILDFKNNKDTILLDDNLWSGNKSVNKVLNQFGTQNGADFVLNFDGGDILTIKNTTKAELKNDIDII